MICFVIVAFIFLQNPAECDRAGNKKQIRGGNDHNDREKENGNRGNRILHRKSEIIRRAENENACRGSKPVGFRRFFARALAFEQANRVCKPYLQKSIKINNKENSGELHCRHHNRRITDGKGKFRRPAEYPYKAELGEL